MGFSCPEQVRISDASRPQCRLVTPRAPPSADRIIHPMKRDPKYRGQADKWEQCSWDEATDLVANAANEITEKYGAEIFQDIFDKL